MNNKRLSPPEVLVCESKGDDAGAAVVPLPQNSNYHQNCPRCSATFPEALFCTAKGARLFLENLVKSVARQYGKHFDYDEVLICAGERRTRLHA
ncbi:hypothetical protein KIN20_013943 [Parelaphostrongylus tenuis]|uniref:Uncharacterized protein n=1 Tax=Parelaphostrongylus tenuis TaxID=148309 RepID=A0AAD5QLC2_PARTN|nr:hypothetical protein KIN20_013942 [Parelaphostrongylus tenuis]KAJ1356264.1 hypothetical protein KIN20_013943 [Parelaphostrongylus tenuis]